MKKVWVAIAVIAVEFAASSAMADTAISEKGVDVAQLRHDADQGDPEAQLSLAEAYHDGAGGLKKDDAEAVKWFKKAAEQNDLEGEYNLGIAYYRGIGTKKDLNEAVSWFHKAAEQGYPDAQYILASAYQNGVGGLPKNPVQSDMWLGLAEAQGNNDAARERISLESTMTEKEIAEANQLLRKRSKHLPNPE